MSYVFVVVLVGVKPIPMLILHYGMTSYLVTNADWNYSEKEGNMSVDKRELDSMTNILLINEIRRWQCDGVRLHGFLE